MRVAASQLRLVPVAAGAWLALGVGLTIPNTAAWLAAALWTASLGLLVVALARRRAARWLVIAVVCGAVAATAVSHLALAQPARDELAGLAVDGGRAIEVIATLTGKPSVSAAGQLRVDAQASLVTIGTERHRVDAPISIRSTAPAASGLAVGAVVEIAGTAFRADADDRAVLVVDASRELRVRAPPTGVLQSAAALRTSLADAVAGLPEPGAGLVPGLAVGDTGAVSGDLDAAMKSSSLSHLTAVSGANCAIVVGLVFALTALCGARRGVRVGASLVALVGFVVLVTPEPSVVRAAVMAAIAMLGVALGRAAAGLSLLCVAVAGALAADPWLATSLGFALSVAATASLLVLARPLAAGMQRAMPRALALILSVPIAAQLACGPLLILINPTVPLYGVAANLIAGPAAPVATILGLGACLAAPLPLLQAGLAAMAWLPAAWIAGTAEVLGSLPGGRMPWPEGLPGLLLLALVGAAVVLLIAGGRIRPLMRLARTTAGVALSALLGVSAGLGALGTVAGPLTVPTGWSVLACDVGQGDAVLLRSAGRIALVDTGPDPAPLQTCLSRLGIGRIDLLVLTHYDLDHVGGVAAVTGMTATVLHGPPADASDRGILARLAAGGARVLDGFAGLAGTLGDADWRVLWPPQRSVAFPSGNDASVVLDVRGGGIPAILMLGDMGASSQRALAASGALRPPSGVVKVAHHGSADQDAGLYELARPAVALVSVGVDNDYGHPRPETLGLLQAVGAVIARTDADGVVAVSATGSGVSVWRERAPPGVGPAG